MTMDYSPSRTRIVMPRRRVAIVLLAAAAAFGALHVVQRAIRRYLPLEQIWIDVVERFDIAFEVSIPMWWAQTQLLFAAVLLAFIAWRSTEWRRSWAALVVRCWRPSRGPSSSWASRC